MASSKKIGRSVEESVGKALSNIGSMKPDMKGGDTELKSAVAPKKAPSFAEAFRAARKDPEAMKRGTFTWGGKSYTTKMAGESPKRSGTAPAKPAVTAAKPAAKADVSASTRRFMSNLPMAPKAAANKPAATTPAKPAAKADVSAATRSFVSKLPTKPAATTPAKPAVKTRTSKDRSAEALGRMGKPAAKSSGRPLLLTGDSAREANRKQRTIGGKAKGGKIDGIAISIIFSIYYFHG